MSIKFSREFSNLKDSAKGMRLESEPESFGYCQWVIRLYPNGRPDGSRDGWCGVFLSHNGVPIMAESSLAFGKHRKLRRHLYDQDVFGFHQFVRTENLPPVMKIEVKISLCSTPTEHLIQKVINSQKFTDAEIESNTIGFDVHKVVLSSQSAVFDRMFQSGMEEDATSTLLIDDFSDEVIKLFVGLLYGCMEKLPEAKHEDKLELLRLTDKYAAVYAQLSVEQDLEKTLTIDNCISTLAFASSASKFNLKDTVLQFIKKNIKEVMEKHETTMIDELGGKLAMEVMRSVAK